jgi:hypothetical protein
MGTAPVAVGSTPITITVESKVLYTNPPQSDRSGLYKWGM